jgi:alkanesulfonate monooxygenase SsuD/methylene tetrahydromethanopterin reductase-like flavin-dependent oxidoreductase (luciferase family)
MQYALTLPNGGVCSNPRTLAEFASLAEQAGWEAVFLEDYIIWQGHSEQPTYDPWVSLAAMAMRTSTLRLGTMVTALPRRRPWKVAREAISLDHLSSGRVILGIGLGDSSVDTSFSHFGEETDLKKRAMMLDEALQVLAGLMTGQPFSFEGQFYHLKEITLLPSPVQKPRIPIWIGGIWPRKGPLQRALRWDGSCLYKEPPDEDFTVEDVRQMKALVDARPASAASFDITVGHAVWQRNSDPDKERAYIRSLAEAGATWWNEYIPPDEYTRMLRWIEQGPLRSR